MRQTQIRKDCVQHVAIGAFRGNCSSIDHEDVTWHPLRLPAGRKLAWVKHSSTPKSLPVKPTASAAPVGSACVTLQSASRALDAVHSDRRTQPQRRPHGGRGKGFLHALRSGDLELITFNGQNQPRKSSDWLPSEPIFDPGGIVKSSDTSPHRADDVRVCISSNLEKACTEKLQRFD